MKRPIIIATIILLVVTVVVIKTKSLTSKSQQLRLAVDERPPKENRLKWYAAKAKDQGVAEVQIVYPFQFIDYLGSGLATVEEALSYYSLVVARPTQFHTLVDKNDDIFTWYKFEIVESLNKIDKPACQICRKPSPPSEMFSLSENDFVTGKYGGTAEVDGIKITMTDREYPDFKIGKEYLLFISRYDNGAATIGMGPNSIFTVESGGYLLKFNNLPNEVKNQIEREYGKSLSNVRSLAGQIRDSKRIK